MSSESQQGQISNQDSQFSVDLKTNKIKKKTKRRKLKKNHKIISSTYKKQKCLHFNKGNCAKGQTCTFSHDFEPQRSKIICKYFLSNACSKGSDCNFSHSTQEYPCKFFHLENRCNQGGQCRFSHLLPINQRYVNDFIKENKDAIMNIWRQQRLNSILDENLIREIIMFINKEISQQEPKKKGFKGQLKLLAQYSIEQAEQVIKPKPIDPRLKLKNIKPIKIQQSQIIESGSYFRDWITQVPQFSPQQTKILERVIDKNLIQKFLYSYY